MSQVVEKIKPERFTQQFIHANHIFSGSAGAYPNVFTHSL